jgi:hypothetical protein
MSSSKGLNLIEFKNSCRKDNFILPPKEVSKPLLEACVGNFRTRFFMLIFSLLKNSTKR